MMHRFLKKLARSKAGVAMTEFALAAPLLLTAGLWGTEVAWLALTNLRVSQVTMQLADNGSRIGDSSTLQNRKIYESDINDILVGATIHGGGAMDLYEHGRVVVSSLEVIPGSNGGKQYIHWQRCLGKMQVGSAYGPEGHGLNSPNFKGMGPTGKEVSAIDEQDAVIYVEIEYDYQPLFSDVFVGNTRIRAEGSFSVRESRDLSQVYQKDPNNPDPQASCTKYNKSVS
ncbi:hypothetical protein [Paraurantiacibacter namhicola]|uniref:TadE-like protein n=1 Tax=Paraurantiacibacter namhicola TaxID=645517 RepID=A0A1C7D9E0_9SPHN|nr:hypothetical protein [Paraurantiacibacter namhicola]ANU08045.1 hypothetical protein A6F65_01748 [Paraurantiacibacter namhicola]